MRSFAEADDEAERFEAVRKAPVLLLSEIVDATDIFIGASRRVACASSSPSAEGHVPSALRTSRRAAARELELPARLRPTRCGRSR